MSFQNYGDSFQGQQAPEEAGGPGAAGGQPQQPPMGQSMEASPGQFQAGNGGAPGTSPTGQQQGESKTTLWSVYTFQVPIQWLTIQGWASLSLGSTRTLFVRFGLAWGTKSTSR